MSRLKLGCVNASEVVAVKVESNCIYLEMYEGLNDPRGVYSFLQTVSFKTVIFPTVFLKVNPAYAF